MTSGGLIIVLTIFYGVWNKENTSTFLKYYPTWSSLIFFSFKQLGLKSILGGVKG